VEETAVESGFFSDHTMCEKMKLGRAPNDDA